MEQHIDFIEELQKEVVQEEISYYDLKTLNRNLNSNDSIILYVNIRSLNSNHTKLDILVKSLKIKSDIIVCAETWDVQNLQYFRIPGYNLYYNNSTINQNDGVVVYINESVTETTDTIEIGKLKILHIFLLHIYLHKIE